MSMGALLFWILLLIVFYAYLGYGILLYFLVKLKGDGRPPVDVDYEPDVTLFVAAYNEKDYVEAKVNNSLSMDYPAHKIHHLWITDGSDDGTPELLKQYKQIEVLHEARRGGKIGAINRGMQFVKTPIVIFSDGNTMLGKQSIREIVKLFSDKKTGCVSGEKRIYKKDADTAAGAGEGIYWQYESKLKQWDAQLYSVVGAAGELFAIRTELFETVERDTLLDDFIISLRIAMQGYTIQYNPEAYAIETASADVQEELKRKIRIAAGGIQSVVRLRKLLNPFRYGTLSFQYISHRVLRWTLAPLALPIIFILNGFLAFQQGLSTPGLYTVLLGLQIIFYLAACLGWYLENKSIKIKLLFIPYYFFIMNLAVFLGFFRYIKGSQGVNWERAKRGAA